MMNGSSNINNNLDGVQIHDDISDRIDADDEDGSMTQLSLDGEIRDGSGEGLSGFFMDLVKDLWFSSGIVINNRLNWLLVLGPIALFGDATKILGKTLCFIFSGLALIPCAERYVLNNGMCQSNVPKKRHKYGRISHKCLALV